MFGKSYANYDSNGSSGRENDTETLHRGDAGERARPEPGTRLASPRKSRPKSPGPAAVGPAEMLQYQERMAKLRGAVEELAALDVTLQSLLHAFHVYMQRQRDVANTSLEVQEILQAKALPFLDEATRGVLAQYQSVSTDSRATLEQQLLTPMEMGLIQNLENLLSQFRAAQSELASRRKAAAGLKPGMMPNPLLGEDFTANLQRLGVNGRRMVHAALARLLETQVKGAQLQHQQLEPLRGLSSRIQPVDEAQLRFPKAEVASSLAARLGFSDLVWKVDNQSGLFGFLGRKGAARPESPPVAPAAPLRSHFDQPDDFGFPRTNPHLGGRTMAGVGQENIMGPNATQGAFPRPEPDLGAPGVPFPRTADIGSGRPMPAIASDNLASDAPVGAFPRFEEDGHFPRTAGDLGTGKDMQGFGAPVPLGEDLWAAQVNRPSIEGADKGLLVDRPPLSAAVSTGSTGSRSRFRGLFRKTSGSSLASQTLDHEEAQSPMVALHKGTDGAKAPTPNDGPGDFNPFH